MPEGFAQDGEVSGVRAILSGGEAAALHDREAEEVKVIGGDLRDLHLLRRVDSGEVHGAETVGGDVLEDGGLLAPDVEAGGRAADGAAERKSRGTGGAEDDDFVGVGRGDGSKQDAVDDGEDGGVGADAKGEGGEGGEREGGVAEEGAEGMFEVVEDGVHISRLDGMEREWSRGYSMSPRSFPDLAMILWGPGETSTRMSTRHTWRSAPQGHTN